MRFRVTGLILFALVLGCAKPGITRSPAPEASPITTSVSAASADGRSAPAASPSASVEATTASRGHGAERYRLVSQRDEIVSVLRNGMTVIVKRVPSPVMAVRGYVQTGGVYEGKWLGGGLSHLLEHLVAGGTTERRTESENRALREKIGNNSNAYTTVDHTAYFINTTPRYLDEAVDLLTGWLLGAKITDEEYRREYEVVQRELEKGRGEPGRQFYYLVSRNRYRVHPMRVPVIGYQEVIQGLTRDDVYEYYKLTYQPSNMVLVVVGDRDPEEMVQVVQRHVDAAPPGRAFSPDLPAEPPVLTPRTMVATFPKLGQAFVQLAFPTIRLDHPDLYALDLLSGVLSDGESSLLTEEIRDQRQLVSSIGSSSYTPEFVEGTFSISMRLRPERIPEATTAVLDLLERITRDGVSAERVRRAKTQMRVGRIRRLQTATGIASSLAADYLSTGDPHFTDRYVERIEEVTPSELRTVARRYLDRGRLLTTAMLPAEYTGAAGLPSAEALLRPAVPAGARAASDGVSAVTRLELGNGTIVLHKRITTTPLVTATMYSLGGLTAEDARSNGLGHLTMAMLRRGTATRHAQDIAAFFDSIGGTLGTGVGNNTWFWSATSLKEDFPGAIAVFADVVNRPAFPPDEVPAVKQRILAAIESQDADWSSQAFRFFRRAYYGPLNSPYQFQTIGTKENVASFTPEQMREWYEQKVLRGRRVLAIFGDVELAEASRLARQHFGHLPEARGEPPVPRARATDRPVPGRPVIEVDRVAVQKTQQPVAGIVIGFKSDAVIGDPANFPLVVADTITSGYGYPTGYLHEVLRGRGLVYVVHAVHTPGQSAELPGTFLAYAGADPRNVTEVVDLMLENVARVQGTAAEIQVAWFERSKNLIVTSRAMDNETAAEQATTAALDELYGLGYDYHDTFAERISAVELTDVQAVARQRLWRAVVTISTPAPELVEIKAGRREYEAFPPVDLTPTAVQHDSGGTQP